MAAPLPTPTGVVHIRLIYDNGTTGEFGHAVDWAYTGGPPTTGDLNSMATDVHTEWVAHLQGMLSDAMALKRVTLSDLHVPTTPDGEDTTRVIGSRTGGLLTINASSCITFQINRKYRGGKPKSFTPFGLDGDCLDQSAWSSAWIATLSSAWSDFASSLTAISSGSTTLSDQVSVSYIEGPYTAVPNSGGTRYRITGTPKNPPKVDLVLGFTVQQKIGSQRRRVSAIG